ncbi:MAG: tRNA pseudouridine(38-40) synthase TruA, partial [Firmicutes bacterium]|nr:tRNA pseudouridine(38-40) synthase TruA [Bacillota bacterium]
MNILLIVAYDGTNYYGWQRQSGFMTVQQRLEEALAQLYKKDIVVRGSSRTDTGVHCMGQGALYKTEHNIPIDRLPYAVNAFLPNDIVVNKA